MRECVQRVKRVSATRVCVWCVCYECLSGVRERLSRVVVCV